jgi:hypothetical protein
MEIGRENKGASKSQKNDRQAKLFSTFDGRELLGVELPWRGSIRTVGRQTGFYDSVLALSELPKPEDLPVILRLSQQSGIASIWNRVRASRLENDAAALLTALAFSGRKQWVPLIRQFFKIHDLRVGLRGRPPLHATQIKAMVRGIQIDDLMARLSKGFQIRTQLKLAGGFSSDEELVATELKIQGYNQAEIDAIVRGATLQDAAVCLYHATTGKRENVTLDAIRNSYARYKRLRPPKRPA